MSVSSERMEEEMLSNLPSSSAELKTEKTVLCGNVYMASYRREKGNRPVVRHDYASRSPCKVPPVWLRWVSLGGG